MSDLPLRAGGEMTEIIGRYQNMVYGLALARTGYFQSGRTFRDEEHRKAWLLRTAVNMSRRCTCSSWRKKTVPLSERREEAAPFPSDEEKLVWEALCGLEESYRLPLYLYYFQELSAQEIGKALHLRPGTVRMRLSRGREKLREVLKGVFSDE